MQKPFKYFRWALVLSATTYVCHVQAASSTVFGDSEHAKACYQMALMVSKQKNDLLVSTEECDLALLDFLGRRDQASTLVNRGLILARQGDFTKAYRDYEKAIALHKSVKPVALINIGNAQFLQQNYDAAVQQYSEALDLDVKQRHAAVLNRGMALEKLGDWDAAEQDYLTALELIPDWEDATLRLDRVRTKMAKAESVKDT